MEKNNELPKNWIIIELGLVCKVNSGIGFPKIYQGRKEGKYPFYKVGDISKTVQSGNIWLQTADNYVTEQICNKLNGVPFQKGTTVFAKIGEAIKLNRRGISSTDSLFDNNVMCLIPNKNTIEIMYLYYFSTTIKLENYSRATTVPSIRKGDVESIKIPIPPLNEQKRIVLKIEELFSELEHAKITLVNVKIQLKQYVQSLLKSAFEGKLTEKWREFNSPELNIDWFDYDNSRKNIEKNSKIFLNEAITISDEYCWIDFNTITDSMKNGIYKPKNFYSDKGIACLRMYNIEDNKIIWKKIKRMILTAKEISEYQLLPNDILINRVNSLELVGKSALIPEGLEDCVFESKNIRLRVKTENMDPKYVYFWLTIGGRHYFYKNFQQTTGMASINQTQLGNLPIPYCTIGEQKEIVLQIEQGLSLIENAKNITNSMLYQLDTLHSTILKKAFEGKLVPQDPNDEPASELLKK